MTLRNQTGAIGAAAPAANRTRGEPPALHERDDEDDRCSRRQQRGNSRPGGQGDSAREAGDNGKSIGRVTQEARAGEQHQGEEEEGDRLRQDLGAEHDERHRKRGQNAGDQSDQRRDQGAEGGNEHAGPCVDDGLQNHNNSRDVAEDVPDAAEQQRIQRHAVGLRQQRRHEALGSRQLGAEFPVGEAVRLHEEGFVAGEERDVDQANEQGEDEHGLERMSSDATGNCGGRHRLSRDRSEWSVIGMQLKRKPRALPMTCRDHG